MKVKWQNFHYQFTMSESSWLPSCYPLSHSTIAFAVGALIGLVMPVFVRPDVTTTFPSSPKLRLESPWPLCPIFTMNLYVPRALKVTWQPFTEPYEPVLSIQTKSKIRVNQRKSLPAKENLTNLLLEKSVFIYKKKHLIFCIGHRVDQTPLAHEPRSASSATMS